MPESTIETIASKVNIILLQVLAGAIASRIAKVAVVGLGVVGTPVAASVARAGFTVLGLDIMPEKVDALNAGRVPFEGEEPELARLLAELGPARRLKASQDYELVREVDLILLAVETPVDDQTHKPAYKALRTALESLEPVLKPGALVIVESTIAPGTIDQLVVPLLSKGSKRLNRDFYVAHCPERLMPGKLLLNIETLPRVIGASHPAVAEVVRQFYHTFVRGDLDVTDCLTAELVKTAENAYRDVQIAFANEMALICEELGSDVWSLRELVNKSPGRNMLLPGAGVGGHCIPKDPWLLVSNLTKSQPRLIRAARAINDSMPLHVFELVREALAGRGLPLEGARIAVLGVSYLPESGDTRNSPTQPLVEALEEAGSTLKLHDPYVPPHDGKLEATLKGCQAVIIMVAHQLYREALSKLLADLPGLMVVIDGRNVLAGLELAKQVPVYTVGRSWQPHS